MALNAVESASWVQVTSMDDIIHIHKNGQLNYKHSKLSVMMCVCVCVCVYVCLCVCVQIL